MVPPNNEKKSTPLGTSCNVANEDGCEKQDGTGAPKVSGYFNVSHPMSAMLTEQRGGV